MTLFHWSISGEERVKGKKEVQTQGSHLSVTCPWGLGPISMAAISLSNTGQKGEIKVDSLHVSTLGIIRQILELFCVLLENYYCLTKTGLPSGLCFTKIKILFKYNRA